MFLGSLSSNRAGEAAGDPTFGNLFNLFRPAIRIPSQIMTRIPRFRFKDRPKPNPIRIQNVFVDPPIVPINVAQPGEPGGGGTPASNPAIADNLVPRGLRPVAVFPPYLFPRTVPAQCLIFLEPDPQKNILIKVLSKLFINLNTVRVKQGLLAKRLSCSSGTNQQIAQFCPKCCCYTTILHTLSRSTVARLAIEPIKG